MQTFDLDVWDIFKSKLSFIYKYYAVTIFRRVIRFIALPYCFFYMVNWNECKVGKFKVANDFLYIFFVLRYFPDNYSLCRLWEKDKKEWVYYYGSNYDPYQRRNLRLSIQRKEYEIIFDNKYICYQMCISEDLPLPKQYGYFDKKSNLIEKIYQVLFKNPHEKLILKPVDGRAGKRIKMIWKQNSSFFYIDDEKSGHIESMLVDEAYVLQTCISQHSQMSKIYGKSVNTIRIVTFLDSNNEVIIVGAFARFGVGDSFVDNSSKGGVAVGIITDKGTLMEFGYNFCSQRYTKHPNSKVPFLGFDIPMWSEVLELAIKTQTLFPYFRLLGHDIAITPNGPVIIELNSSYDNVGLESKCGPILKNKKLLEEYDRNMLLINKKQKKLIH